MSNLRPSICGAVAVAAALAVMVLTTGCRPGRFRPALPGTLPTANSLLGVLASRRASVASIRSFAQIAYQSGEENLGSRHAVLARRPDHFRLEVLSPFGALAVIACDGDDLVVYARRESRMYRGDATPESVAAYAAVPVPVLDVVTVLLGTPPARSPAGVATVAWDVEAALIKLVIPLEGERQEVWFAPGTLRPVASTTPLPDGRTLHVDFADYRDAGTLAFPYSIDLRAEPGDRAVHVRYTSPSLNTDIADTLFTFAPRPGITELRIEQYPQESPSS